MTAGSNGTNTPEGDDPFGYLYRSEDGAPEGQNQQAGVPRTSYNQVRAVGERRYGQQRPHPDAQSPSAYYAAPEAQPMGPGNTGGPGGPGGGHGAGRGGSGGPERPKRRNGLLIGALAVVAAVVVGVGAAVAFSDDDSEGSNANPQPSETADPGEDEDEQPEESEKPEEKPAELPKEDATSLRLDDGPQVGDMVEGSRAKNGGYIAGFTKEGATATWTVNVEEPGDYRLYIGYTVPGKNMSMNVAANDADPYPTRFDNFANAKEGEWKKGWTHTYAEVTAKEGANSFRISCGDDVKKCEVAVDRVWLSQE